MDIEDWRQKIDEVDLQILNLLNLRAQFSINIGYLKRELDLPVHSPEREKEIIERIENENQGPMGADGVRRVFERIIDESRMLEKQELAKIAREN